MVRRKNKVKYPIFSECVSLTLDPDWKLILEKCSFGRFPKHVSFINDSLHYRYKTKMETHYISKDPKKAIIIVLNMFRNTLGLSSKKEETVRKKTMTKRSDKIKILDSTVWNDIKNNKTKNIMVREYIREKTITDNLTKEQSKQLFGIINMGMAIDQISTIKVQHLKIIEIDNIIYDNILKNFKFGSLKDNTKKSCRKSCRKPVAVPEEQSILFKYWDDFLSSIKTDKDNLYRIYQDINTIDNVDNDKS
jgi:hypothetical protein